jgi:ribosomal protein L40E
MTKRLTCELCGADNHFGNINCKKCGKGLSTL